MRAPRLASCRWPKVQQCQSVRTTRPRPTRRRVADGDVLECLSVNDGRAILNLRLVERRHAFRNQQAEYFGDGPLLSFVEAIAIEPLPVGHQLVVFDDFAPWSRQA